MGKRKVWFFVGPGEIRQGRDQQEERKRFSQLNLYCPVALAIKKKGYTPSVATDGIYLYAEEFSTGSTYVSRTPWFVSWWIQRFDKYKAVFPFWFSLLIPEWAAKKNSNVTGTA